MIPKFDKNCASGPVPDQALNLFAVQLTEKAKILKDLHHKYRFQLSEAGWWRRILIRRKIATEAEEIFRQQLYSAQKAGKNDLSTGSG
jgi:hypothetical protein